MYELEKLNEASYFFTRMQRERDAPLHFSYNLSAFLSAARSVLQFASKEAKQKNRQHWYDEWIENQPVLKFLRDRRNVSIHEKPVQPTKAIAVQFAQVIAVADSVTLKLLDTRGNFVGYGSSRPLSPATPPQTPQTLARDTYIFDDWDGPEDVFQLARLYLDKLDELVRDGQARGILTRVEEDRVMTIS